MINITCKQALLIGYASNITKIDGKIVRQCANELKILVNKKFNDEKELEIIEKKANEKIVPNKNQVKRASRIFTFIFTILIIIVISLYIWFRT